VFGKISDKLILPFLLYTLFMKEKLLNHRLFVMVYTFFIIAIASGTLKMIVSNNYALAINKILIVAGIIFSIILIILLFLEIVVILKLSKKEGS